MDSFINDESWNYDINIEEIENKSNSFFELQFNNLCEKVVKALDSRFINVVEDLCLARNNDEELIILIEKNNELKYELETILQKLSQQQSRYESFKRDQKILKQEVKETHEAFLMARKQFKQFLNIYYTIESRSTDKQIVFVQFFTEVKKNGELYSVNLQRNTKTRQYKLQSTNPKLKNFKELQQVLQKTNDIPTILCFIREAFLAHKLKDKENREYIIEA